eukprot:scaffold19380_cov107-Isochrysis_galbana.AAC.3
MIWPPLPLRKRLHRRFPAHPCATHNCSAAVERALPTNQRASQVSRFEPPLSPPGPCDRASHATR